MYQQKSSHNKNRTLALFGGKPVRTYHWPKWPRAGAMSQRAVLDVLHSECWTISAGTHQKKSYEQNFGEKFANYIGRNFGIPCSSGSTALTIALQALEIGPGDEVIVPGLTWVACASAVIHLGATPIFADITTDSWTMSPDAVVALITPATKAVLAVHMYSSRVDILSLEKICKQHDLFLVEDGSQAHGAMLDTKRVGNFGVISVFSMQQTKLLSSGEGGIALTDDPILFNKLQQLRADGRTYATSSNSVGQYKLIEQGDVLGRNGCMSEFHAAILLEGLLRLDSENIHRTKMVNFFEEELSLLGYASIRRDSLKPAEGATFYKVPLYFEKEIATIGPVLLAEALAAELQLPITPIDYPLNNNPLYTPLLAPIVEKSAMPMESFSVSRFHLPIAAEAWDKSIVLPHYCFLGAKEDIFTIISALRKIFQNFDELLEADYSR